MIIDPANATLAIYENKTAQRTAPAEEIFGEQNVNNEGRPEAGQTSLVAPAVVTNISAAALEAASALNAPEQTANATRPSTTIQGEETGQNRAANEERAAAAQQAARESRLNVIV